MLVKICFKEFSVFCTKMLEVVILALWDHYFLPLHLPIFLKLFNGNVFLVLIFLKPLKLFSVLMPRL